MDRQGGGLQRGSDGRGVVELRSCQFKIERGDYVPIEKRRERNGARGVCFGRTEGRSMRRRDDAMMDWSGCRCVLQHWLLERPSVGGDGSKPLVPRWEATSRSDAAVSGANGSRPL